MKAFFYSAINVFNLNRRFKVSAIGCMLLFFCSLSYGQKNNPWTLISAPSLQFQNQFEASSLKDELSNSATFKLHPFQLQWLLSDGGKQEKIIVFPMPDGNLQEFVVEKSIIMESGLSEKFPQIQTFVGKTKDRKNLELRFDISPNGLHAIIQEKNETIYINPVSREEKDIYKSYKKSTKLSSINLAGWEEGLFEFSKIQQSTELLSTKEISIGNQLKVYRLAVAATGEYSEFHGGTTSSVLAAIVTAVNRVNGIFERELGIRLILVADNEKLIFLDPNTDPYSNGKGAFMISQNQTTVDNLIGFDNYDVGHVFGKGKIGDAYIGSVCSSQKAAGASGTDNPIGDPFYIDFFAHELGHQLGAHHTHNNSCLRNEETAFEPASGSTIMGYAGICPPNLQGNSDPYFHTSSFEEIRNFISEGPGKDCGEILEIPNNTPTIESLEGISDLVIPANTPFQLRAFATDLDDDPLTYCWEQFDLGPTGEWDQPEGSAPIFRSFPPKKSGIRTFPKIETLVSNESVIGEVLSSYSRDLNFRLTVRDGKGGVTFKDTKIAVTDNLGPFEVSSPNENLSLEAGTEFDIVWEPGETFNGPVNCNKVNILLSVDGGFTFDDTLKLATANDGIESVSIPFKITQNARIKVEAADNIFFDISDVDFAITPPTFSFSVEPDTNYICIPGTAVFNLSLNPILNFDDSVMVVVGTLPGGLTSNFSEIKIIPPYTTQLIVSDTGSAISSGEYLIKLYASSDFETKEEKLSLNLSSNNPGIVHLVYPVNPGIEVSTQPDFSWKPLEGKNDYQLEISKDSGFSSIEYLFSEIDTISFSFPGYLESQTDYFWRVRGENICGPGKYSKVHHFRTVKTECELVKSENVPINIPENTSGTVYSEIEINNYSRIQDIKIHSIKGGHSYVGDLEMSLIHPEGREVKLFSRVCGDDKDFSIGFNDSSSISEIICPLNNDKIYLPLDKLSILEGLTSGGKWKLAVTDVENQDGGQLDSWALEICTIPMNFNFSSKVLSQSQIDLNWDDIFQTETAYVIERSKGNNENFQEIAFLENNVNSYVDEALDTFSVYFYRIKAIIGEDGYSYSGELNNTTFPKIPKEPDSLQASNITQSALRLSWNDNSDNEDAFVIEIATSPENAFSAVDTASKNQSSIEITNLEPNTNYLFRVKAVNLGGESNSKEISVKTLEEVPVPPSDLEAEPLLAGKMALSWKDRSENETGFILDRSIRDSLAFEPIATLPEGTEFFIDSMDIQPEEKYFYKIRAINSAGISNGSNTAFAFSLPNTPNAPEDLRSNFKNDFSARILWKDTAEDEDGFIIERSKANTNNFVWVDSLTANTTTYLDESLFPEVKYFYRVKAYNRGGNSNPSSFIEIQTLPEKFKRPTNLSASNASPTSIYLEWTDNGMDELGFVVERAIEKTSNFDSIFRTNENISSFIDEGLINGTIYTYRVYALYADGKSRGSNEFSIKVGDPLPSAPFGLRADSLLNDRVYLSWQSSEKKEGEFVIERSEDNNQNFQVIKTLPNTQLSFIDSSLVGNTTYYYRVKSTNQFGESLYSDVFSIKTLVTGFIEEYDEITLNFYPNPVTGLLHFEFSKNTDSKRVSISIFDYLGREIQSNTHQNITNSFSFDFTPFPSGIYIIHVISNNLKWERKVIKK